MANQFIEKIETDGLNATYNLYPATNGVAEANPAIQLSSGGVAKLNGIKFPATHIPSADANVLDDYEEGTFTPSLNCSYTIGSAGGTYVKIGRQVTVRGKLINVFVTNKTDSALITIGGMPFAAVEGSMGSIIFPKTTYLNSYLAAYPQGTGILVAKMASGSTADILKWGDFTMDGTSITIEFAATYFV